MTYEEAYEILNPNTRHKLAEIKYYHGFSGEEAVIKAVEEACILACIAILEMQSYRNIGTLPEVEEAMKKYKEQQDDLKWR